MWKNIVEWGMPQMTTRQMRFARWVTKATNTHSECVILIPCPRQQQLHKHASVVGYTYIARLVTVLAQLTMRSEISVMRLRTCRTCSTKHFIKFQC